MLTTMIAAAVHLAMPPCEYTVDFSGWKGGRTEIAVRFEDRNGKILEFDLELLPGSTGAVGVDICDAQLEGAKWRFERLDEFRFVLRGSKSSAIKSVTMKSDTWAPTVKCKFPPVPNSHERKKAP